MLHSSKLKGISSVIGAILIDLVLGSVYTWSNINSYFVSYLKYHDTPSITLVDGYFLMPIIIFISNVSSYFGPKLDTMLGIKRCLQLTLLMTISAHLILYNTTKLNYVYIAMSIFGLGIGFSYIPIMKNCWLYFPDKKGLISGMILLGYGSSAFIFTWISDNIVNPNMEKVDTVTGFFHKEIADRTHKFIFVLNIILFIMGCIGYAITFDYLNEHGNMSLSKDTREILLNISNKIATTSITEQHVHNNETQQHKNNNKHIDNTINNSNLKEILHDKRIYQIIIMNFCTLYFCFMVTNTNRSFGQLNLLNEKVLSNLSKVAAIINGSGRLVWGALFDKFGFKKLYILIVAVEIGISSTIFQFGNNTIVYFIMVCVTALLLAGNIALMIPLYPKIFGIKYGTEVNGICIALYSFSCILGPVVAKFVVHERKDYQRLYLSGTVLAVISFIVVCMFKEEPFVFKNDKKTIPHNISKELRNDVFIGDDNEATEMEQV